MDKLWDVVNQDLIGRLGSVLSLHVTTTVQLNDRIEAYKRNWEYLVSVLMMRVVYHPQPFISSVRPLYAGISRSRWVAGEACNLVCNMKGTTTRQLLPALPVIRAGTAMKIKLTPQVYPMPGVPLLCCGMNPRIREIGTP